MISEQLKRAAADAAVELEHLRTDTKLPETDYLKVGRIIDRLWAGCEHPIIVVDDQLWS